MSPETSVISAESVLQCCPFSFLLDAEGRIAKLGRFFKRHHPEIIGKRCDEAFTLMRGDAAVHGLFAGNLEALAHVGEVHERTELKLRQGGKHIIGSLLPLTHKKAGALFIGTIAPQHIAHVTDYGLTMSDFAPFDASADFAMMAQVNEAVLKDTRLLNERLSVARDEAVAARRKIEAIALVDALSGLGSRAAFQRTLDAAAGDGRNGKELERCSLLVIDVDNFKPINDHYGHAVGDGVIQSAGERIRGAIDATAEAFRIGGDEFAVIFRGATPRQARQRAGKIVRALSKMHHVLERRITVSVSAGLASRTLGVHDLDSLYKAADIALYEAKRSATRKLQSFTSGMGQRELEKKLLERDLVEAVEREELDVFIQPQFDIRTGALCGGEALARWWNRRLGRRIPPAEFVPMAETYGLISQIDLFVFATVLRQQRALGEKAQGLLWTSNLSPLTVGQEDLVRRMRAIVDRIGGLSAPTGIEITESAIVSEAGTIADTLQAIRDMGMEVAIDDFGAGQTSLSHLTRLPITRLKLDRSLVERIDNDERAETIAQAIVALALKLGLRVTAEGIERPLQAEKLRRMAPMRAQGFLFAQPMPLAEFAALLGARERPGGGGRLLAG